MIARLSLALLAVLVTACADAPGPLQQTTVPPDGDPYIEGTVEQLDAAGSPASMLVAEPGGGNQAMLRLTGDTRLLKEFGGGFEPASIGELREGQTVAAWVSGPIAESFPVQANADAVVVRP